MTSATLSGIEHDPGSDLTGQVAVENIQLWDSPARKKVKAKARHGTPVRILNTETGQDGRTYLKVKALGWRNLFKRSGWVSEPFVAIKE